MRSDVADLTYDTRPDVYTPSDDTFLLMDCLDRLPGGSVLEIGTGAGLVAIQAARLGHRVVATDVNPQALRLARANARRNGVRVEFARADLTRGLRLAAFDAVIMNPPYLPTLPMERIPGPLNRAFDGGPDGRAAVQRFFQDWPLDAPPAWIVTSSLQGMGPMAALARDASLVFLVEAERKLPWETLSVVRFSRRRERATRKG